jgi:hypothetical protein
VGANARPQNRMAPVAPSDQPLVTRATALRAPSLLFSGRRAAMPSVERLFGPKMLWFS